MNKSQRILFNSGSTMNTKLHLEQNVDTIEFLSMNISAEDVYRDFNSDYGVLIGRVTANGGVGIGNAKISIFIPLSDADSLDSEMSSLYPYKSPRDKNLEGKRYNLLPRVSIIDPNSGVVKPKQAFGSFPLKEEIVTNQSLMNMYKKYYKYTALTNSSGDYMIFGVPIGSQTVHMSVDITDIGDYSMSPKMMIDGLGYSPNLFTSDRKSIKPSTDLNDLPNIETQDIAVNVIPFWGDKDNFEIGITRQDFRIRTIVKSSFILFGSAYTDGYDTKWGNSSPVNPMLISCLYSQYNDVTSVNNKRSGAVDEKIYYYLNSVSDADIDSGNIDTDTDIKLLDKSEYVKYSNNGDFVFIVPCNRNKIITNEFGNTVVVNDDSPNGIYSEFRGFVVLGMPLSINELSIVGTNGVVFNPFRVKYKFPQHSPMQGSFQPEIDGLTTSSDNAKTDRWRKQSYIFKMGKNYTFSKYHSVVSNQFDAPDTSQCGGTQGFMAMSHLNTLSSLSCSIGFIETNNSSMHPHNFSQSNPTKTGFAANWMNIGVYFPQISRKVVGHEQMNGVYAADYFSEQRVEDTCLCRATYNSNFATGNSQKFVACETNTFGYPRSDIHWTDIVEVPSGDILKMSNIQSNGFCKNSTINNDLTGSYRGGVYVPNICASDTINCWCSYTPNNLSIGTNGSSYFYKGHCDSDVIKYIIDLNLI